MNPLIRALGDRARDLGNGRWAACCPAHDDRSPSLSIRETEGALLFHCHAGCSPDSILEALGLRWGDLYPDPWDAAKRAAHSYHRRGEQQRIDLEHERMILQIARNMLAQDRPLSLEDQARVKLAAERVRAMTERTA